MSSDQHGHEHPTGKPPEQRLRIENRFWEKVEIRDEDQCWPWKNYLDSKGYGRFWVGSDFGKTTAHRMALALAQGLTNPDDLDSEVVRHTCDTEECCNPNHLLTGSYTDNNHDAVMRGGIDHDYEPYEIREMRYLDSETDTTRKEIADEYETSITHVVMICERDRYAWVE